MSKQLVLLDVDGVLIHAQGYRVGIRQAFEYVAEKMGQTHLPAPQHADMLAFEARSIIFEWDSMAICLAAYLAQAPHLHALTLAETLANIRASGEKLRPISYADLAAACPEAEGGVRPARAALGTLFPATPLFEEVLGHTHDIHAPMTRLLQNLALGYVLFQQTYGLTPEIYCGSLLAEYDSPHLTPANRERLLQDPQTHPVMYTARPSLPPSFVTERLGYAPEAEIAQQLLGLEGIPAIGYGKVAWLAQQEGVPPSDYVKPAPLHSLIAIFSALLLPHSPTWEQEAYAFALSVWRGTVNLPPLLLDSPWRVIVCEDSASSIRGVREACRLLSQWHEVDCVGVGVAHEAKNQAVLSAVADYVTHDVNEGLAWALGWQMS
jgi:hypothetical protein